MISIKVEAFIILLEIIGGLLIAYGLGLIWLPIALIFLGAATIKIAPGLENFLNELIIIERQRKELDN